MVDLPCLRDITTISAVFFYLQSPHWKIAILNLIYAALALQPILKTLQWKPHAKMLVSLYNSRNIS